jgi:hypothetical protein
MAQKTDWCKHSTAHALQPHTEIAYHFTDWLNRLFNSMA